MNHKETAYVYLLRCWPAAEANQPSAWRFQVEEVTGPRRRWRLADLDALVAFLQSQLAAPQASDGGRFERQ